MKKNMTIVRLGVLFDIDVERLAKEANRSSLMHIKTTAIDEPPFQGAPSYADLAKLKRCANDDFTIYLVQQSVPEGHFSFPFPENQIVVVSAKELECYSALSGIPSERLALRIIYGIILLHQAYGNRLPTWEEVGDDKFMQLNTKRCLMDYSMNKDDIKRFFDSPGISIEVRSILRTKYLPDNFLSILEKEILRLRTSRFERMVQHVRSNTVSALLVSFALGLAGSALIALIQTKYG